MDKKKLQHTLSQPFDLTQWQVLLKDVFGVKEFFNKPVEIPLPKNKEALAAYELGGFETADEKKVGLYLVKVKPEVWLEVNRVGLRKLLRNVYKHEVDGALIVFEQDEKWRLSFVSEIRTLDERGNVVHNVTQPKRYTYLLGQGEKTKTPADRFNNVAGKKLYLEDIKQLFSVSTLTKEFYNELFQWYQWTLSEDVKITFPKNTKITEDDREKLEEQIIRLITRLLFVWFIKQKHLVPDLLFDAHELKKVLKDFDPASSEDSNYYNAILQNLFFATLNKAVGERAFAKLKNARDIKTLYRYAEMFSVPEKKVLELFRPIPFLNGGLFECLDKEDADGNQYFLDGFSRNDKKSANGSYKHRAFIPNCVFFDEHRGILPLLQRYNFTVEERAPEEVQVALDPELLGNVFENLLGAFNSETKDTARKQSGSFYTPREIVDYMVSESLIAYLHNKCPKVEIEILRSLFDEESLPPELQGNEKLCQQLSDQLKLVKIIDPACGSGAFPMGILQKMVEVLEKLDIHHTKTAYEQKLHLIEECIYGADIQTIAAQISKLRFFISLIVEQGRMDLSRPEDNYGVITLPNLETKFVAANTLIGLKKKPAQTNLFEDPRIDDVKKEILEVRHEHFYAKTAHAKKQLREKDEKLRAELARLLAANGDFAPEDARQLAQWNPYDQNQSAPFFDLEWMFGIKDGFDIVIGNPPYISTKGISKEFKKILEGEYRFSDDTYNHFFFKGIFLLKYRGVLSYITPKTFWTTQTKRNLRDLLLSKKVLYIYDTANPFEAAMVDTCVTSVVNDNPANNIIAFLDGSEDLYNPKRYIVAQDIYINSQNAVIFKPTEENMKIYKLYGHIVKELYNEWWDKISTSKNIDKNKKALEKYRKSLKPGDIALLGCLTEGGQGLATANNGKYIAIRKSTKWAQNVINSRPVKLAEVVRKYKVKIDEIANYSSIADYLTSLSEMEIAELFDGLKEKYGRDIFGQGYIYRLIDDADIADVSTLTDDEKNNGIDINKKYYVPYDKGDKDGNRWYLETPFAIAWTKENVGFLKTDPSARYQGYMFYFREGFCWSDINTTFLKCRLKQKSINDVKSMSMYSMSSIIPDFFIICIINSSFMSFYVDNFVNNTQTFQINDARQLPFFVPTEKELKDFRTLFDQALTIKQNLKRLSQDTIDTKLSAIQKKLDNMVLKLYKL